MIQHDNFIVSKVYLIAELNLEPNDIVMFRDSCFSCYIGEIPTPYLSTYPLLDFHSYIHISSISTAIIID